MTTSADLYALLALDSYSRGYGPALVNLPTTVGDAKFLYTVGDTTSGFSAAVYQLSDGSILAVC